LNYREFSVLSPIKLYSQITRKSTLYSGRIGHFEMKGTFSKAPNFEFAEMAYGGMLSIFYQRGDSGSFNKKKVVVFHLLFCIDIIVRNQLFIYVIHGLYLITQSD
jgi:hypothetical protein